MKIDRVRAIHVSAEWDYHEPLGEAHLSRPENIYPELAADPIWPVDTSSGPPYPVQARFLLIDTDEGVDRHLRSRRRRRHRHHSSAISRTSSSARIRTP